VGEKRTIERLNAEVREASDPNSVVEEWVGWAKRIMRKKKFMPTSSAYRRAEKILERAKSLQEQLKEQEKQKECETGEEALRKSS